MYTVQTSTITAVTVIIVQRVPVRRASPQQDYCVNISNEQSLKSATQITDAHASSGSFLLCTKRHNLPVKGPDKCFHYAVCVEETHERADPWITLAYNDEE